MAKKLNKLRATGKITGIDFVKNSVTIKFYKKYDVKKWQGYNKVMEVREV